MIDFNATRAAIAEYRETLVLDMGAEDQTSAVMERVCVETPNFDEHAGDAYARNFLGWTRQRNLLVLA